MSAIGFISTRIAGTDGVSHEIEKWAAILERNGHACFYCAGESDRPRDRSFIIDEAHFGHPDIAAINNGVFGRVARTRGMTRLIHDAASRIREGLERFITTHRIDCIVAENSLTIPMNIPLGIALTELIAETGMPTVAHHHDFAWERERFLVNGVADYIQMAFPPALPSIRHVVINSLAEVSLAHRRGVSSTVIPNTFDFDNPPGPSDPELIASIRKAAGIEPGDYLVLQPTRVVPRKSIERSIDLVDRLPRAGRKLVISHPSGDEGEEYRARLEEYARMRNVRIEYIDHVVSTGRASGERPFTIADVYRAADLVTYPSACEGFGNAFLETLYFKKPIVMNRYPVFIADIEPLGFDLCLFDGFITEGTVEEVRGVLEDGERRSRMAEKNYVIAREHFSYALLERLVTGVMAGLTPRSPA
ncbi:MAG: glycosyltransferase family 4 protein [Spirochaetes bacterium]|nr:glycosyltransferase family 4 protein [Spirochaetota bacterium]